MEEFSVERKLSRKEFKNYLRNEFQHYVYYEALDLESDLPGEPQYVYRFDPDSSDVIQNSTFLGATKFEDFHYDTSEHYLSKHGIWYWVRQDVLANPSVHREPNAAHLAIFSERGQYRKVTKFVVPDRHDINSDGKLNSLGNLVLAFIGIKRKRKVPSGCVDFERDAHPDVFLYVKGHCVVHRAYYSNSLIVDYARGNCYKRTDQNFCVARMDGLRPPFYGSSTRLPSKQEAFTFWFHPKACKKLGLPDLSAYRERETPAEIEKLTKSESEDDDSFEFGSDDSFI